MDLNWEEDELPTFASEAKRSLTYFSISFFVFTLSGMSLLSTRVNKPLPPLRKN